MFMFNGFTKKANESLNIAIASAEKMGHSYVGSEHILLGLIKGEDSVASEVLKEKNITSDIIEDKIISSVGTGTPEKLTPADLTPRSKRIMELAVIVARNLGHSYVGTEHILMAIITENENYAVNFINECGVAPQEIYNECLAAIGESVKPSGVFDKDGKNEKNENKHSQTKTLDKFSKDLTQQAKDGRLDPVIGRSEEIERVIQILSRRTKNNPCLIGEPGVGKTAIAEGLAQRIVDNQVPETLKDKRIVSLDLSGMVAGTKYRGDFEERIKNALDEVTKSGNVILFIDELHTIIGAGASEGAVDAANILKPQLARGQIQIIGATTIDEYRKHIEKDAALERRFQPVTVEEPNEEDSISILMGLRDKYEAHHKVRITDEAIKAAVKLSSRYITDRFLPDKAIDLVDEACSKVRLKIFTAPPDLKDIEHKLDEISKEKEEAVNTQNFEKAAKIRDKEKELKAQLALQKDKWLDENKEINKEVSADDIAEIVSSWTRIPAAKLSEQESMRLLKLADTLHERVIGQDEAVNAISRAIKRGRVGLSDPNRPIGSFIFLGPTGVGKTELCKTLAESLFGSEEAMIRLDMSEYMEKHSVSKLVGSPPGYVGFEEGGQLSEKIRRKPYSVVLFDEIEKAHPDVFNMLLQILEDGVLTDSQGRKVNFKNCVIIMTSNVGARLLTEKHKSLGFGGGEDSYEDKNIKEKVLDELKKAFRPEFLNRVDDIIVFTKLTKEDIEKIAGKMLQNLTKRVEKLELSLEYSDEVISKLAKEGYDAIYGARPLRRSITTKIEDVLSDLMLEGKFKSGDCIKISVVDDKFDFSKKE